MSQQTSATSREELAPQLAHHHARGGNPGRAVEYYLSAVRQLAELGSNVEAIAMFNAGLELLGDLPDDDRRTKLEIDLRVAACGPLGDSKGLASAEIGQSIDRALALCKRPGINWERTWWALYNAFWVHHLRPDTRRARDIAAELVGSRAERHRRAYRRGRTSLAWVRMYSGEFELADQGFERAWVHVESIQNAHQLYQRAMDPIAKCVLSRNWALCKTTAWSPGGTCGSSAIRIARWSD